MAFRYVIALLSDCPCHQLISMAKQAPSTRVVVEIEGIPRRLVSVQENPNSGDLFITTHIHGLYNFTKEADSKESNSVGTPCM